MKVFYYAVNVIFSLLLVGYALYSVAHAALVEGTFDYWRAMTIMGASAGFAANAQVIKAFWK